MNVYQKLQTARVKLQNMNLHKSGENKFAGYDYFELADFMPPINEIFLELGLFGKVSFTREFATLTIINTDKPEEREEFTSPMAEANLKGCHDIQNMGAVETYQRRYLYTTALEIVEKDALDAVTGKDKPEPRQTQQQTRTTSQTTTQPDNSGQQQTGAKDPSKRVYALMSELGWGFPDLNKFASDVFQKQITYLKNQMKGEEDWNRLYDAMKHYKEHGSIPE